MNTKTANRTEGNCDDGSSAGRQGDMVQASWPTLSEQALAINPFWAGLKNDESNELLSLSLTALRQTASKSNAILPRQQTLTSSLEEFLEGLKPSGGRHLWERWQWDSQGSLFTSATAFRLHLQQQRIPIHLKSFLTQNTKNLLLMTEQLALQNRMISLQEEIAKYRQTQQQQQNLTTQPFQSKQVINMNMQAVMKEQPYMYHAFAAPLIHAVRQLLPSPRSTISYSGLIEDFGLFFHDVEMLGSEDLDTVTSCFERQIADAARIASIHKKSSRPNAQEDVEQPESASPILGWLYSTNTADHPRQSFPGQSVERSFALLVRALEDLKPWEEKVAQIKTLRETLVQQQSATLEWLKGNGIRRWSNYTSYLIWEDQLQAFTLGTKLEQANVNCSRLQAHANIADDQIDHARKQAPRVVIGEPLLAGQMISYMESTLKWSQERMRVADAIIATEKQLEELQQKLRETIAIQQVEDAKLRLSAQPTSNSAAASLSKREQHLTQLRRRFEREIWPESTTPEAGKALLRCMQNLEYKALQAESSSTSHSRDDQCATDAQSIQ
ncbi:hypothetical protein WJX82_007606 [Trebouxia sp. C0006]